MALQSFKLHAICSLGWNVFRIDEFIAYIGFNVPIYVLQVLWWLIFGFCITARPATLHCAGRAKRCIAHIFCHCNRFANVDQLTTCLHLTSMLIFETENACWKELMTSGKSGSFEELTMLWGLAALHLSAALPFSHNPMLIPVEFEESKPAKMKACPAIGTIVLWWSWMDQLCQGTCCGLAVALARRQRQG